MGYSNALYIPIELIRKILRYLLWDTASLRACRIVNRRLGAVAKKFYHHGGKFYLHPDIFLHKVSKAEEEFPWILQMMKAVELEAQLPWREDEFSFDTGVTIVKHMPRCRGIKVNNARWIKSFTTRNVPPS